MTFRLFVLISGCAVVLLAGSSKISLDRAGFGAMNYSMGDTSPTLSSSAAWGNCAASGNSTA